RELYFFLSVPPHAPHLTLFPYTTLFRSKGGIGTSSRVVELAGESGSVGALVQSNFGGRLAIAGVPMDDLQSAPSQQALGAPAMRSEEHTSELQSRGHLVCRLLLEKKKKK